MYIKFFLYQNDLNEIYILSSIWFSKFLRYMRLSIGPADGGIGGLCVRRGGPDGIRTRDLRDANAALYQLSYRPAMLFQAACLDIERLLKQGLLSSLR